MKLKLQSQVFIEIALNYAPNTSVLAAIMLSMLLFFLSKKLKYIKRKMRLTLFRGFEALQSSVAPTIGSCPGGSSRTPHARDSDELP